MSDIKNKNWQYYIVGDGPDKEKLIQLVKEKNLSNQIIFLGYLDDIKLQYYYALCDIFLLTSKTSKTLEGFGIVYLEANLHEKPVIAASVGGVTDAVIDGETGFLIEENNIKELKEKILLLMNNKELRIQLGKQGKQRVESDFLWDKHIDSLIKIIEA